MGALAAPIAMAAIPVIQHLLSKSSEDKKQATMDQVPQTYNQYRPEIAQSQVNALGNQMQAFAPANTLLSQMGGQSIDLGKVGADPRTEAMKAGVR